MRYEEEGRVNSCFDHHRSGKQAVLQDGPDCIAATDELDGKGGHIANHAHVREHFLVSNAGREVRGRGISALYSTKSRWASACRCISVN